MAVETTLSFCANGAVQQSSDQPEDAKYNEIDGNDITQKPRDKENQDSPE